MLTTERGIPQKDRIYLRLQLRRMFFILLGIGLLISSAPASAEDFSVDLVIAPVVAGAGDLLTFNLWIDNLVEEAVDHTEFILCVERGIEIISYPFECLLLDSGEPFSLLVSTMTHPITSGHFWYFSEPVTAKINASVPSGTTLNAAVTLNVYCEDTPNGQCNTPMHGADTGTIQVESMHPVPEFPGSFIPIVLLGLLFFASWFCTKPR